MKKVELNLKYLYNKFSKSESRASQLIKDKEKTKKTLDQAFQKANANKHDLAGIWDQLQNLFSLVRDYLNGSYKDIPKKSLIAILAGMIYFLSPVDLFPDFVLGFGLIDDMFIIGLVIKQVAKDLEKYQLWRSGQQLPS
ncbi:YkvA family protein [Albibacterium indicum]|uniref:YkvA family protein n=1 Tax=Albibacterium indicum TaxID=2292082 RepID=UPI000E4DE9C1|nr:YkvA family protein [Pedobacter indicus]